MMDELLLELEMLMSQTALKRNNIECILLANSPSTEKFQNLAKKLTKQFICLPVYRRI